jgi:Domain of unknown function (DUF4124)
MKRIIAIAAVTLLAPLASADLYKYVDKNGRTVYSDQPPVNIDSKQISANAGSAASAKTAVEKDKELDKSRKESREKQDKSDKAAAVVRDQEQRCSQARQNKQAVDEGGRLYKYNDKGEREFMSDEEIAAAQHKAQRDVDEACKKG